MPRTQRYGYKKPRITRISTDKRRPRRLTPTGIPFGSNCLEKSGKVGDSFGFSIPGNVAMKKLNWIFFLIFLLGAVLQFNDPDPVIWMAMWGAAAGACLLFGLGITRISKRRSKGSSLESVDSASSVKITRHDPDASARSWFARYGFFGLAFRAVPLLIGIIALIWAAMLIPDVVQSAGDLRWKEVFNVVTMSSIAVEWAREMGGLLIIAAWMGMIYRSSRK